MWLDWARRLVWGQVRPGGAHAVVVQRRLPGAATTWTPVAQVTTADDGTWALAGALVPYASYRAVADDGETSAALVTAPPPASAGPAPLTGTAGGPAVTRRTLSSTPGALVPASFAGLSIEWWALPDYVGPAGHPNAVFARLIRALAAAGNGAPTIRVGGNSTDETWWNPGDGRGQRRLPRLHRRALRPGRLRPHGRPAGRPPAPAALRDAAVSTARRHPARGSCRSRATGRTPA